MQSAISQKWHIQQKGHIRCKLSPSSRTKYENFQHILHNLICYANTKRVLKTQD